MESKLNPIDLAPALAEALKELHDCDLSVQFWSRYILQYARAVCEQKECFSVDTLDSAVPMIPMLGQTPPNATRARTHSALERARGLRHVIERAARFSDLHPAGNDRKVAIGIRAEAVAAACNAVQIQIPFLPPFPPAGQARRRRLSVIASCLLDPLMQNAVRFMPRVFVEYHPSLKATVEKVLIKHQPKEIFYEHFGNYTQRLFGYLGSEKGAILTHVQTGGHVGESLISVNEAKRFEYDRLLTYGWRLGKKDKPFFAVRLEEFKKKYSQKTTSNERLKTDILIVLSPVTSLARQRQYSELIEALSRNGIREKFPHIVLRPRGTSRLISSSAQLRSMDIPDCWSADDGKVEMPKLLSTCRLVIQSEYPSTNFLEALFVDHPAMAIRNDQELTPLAAVHVARLEKLGLLHKTAPDLAAFLEEIELEAWWKTVINSAEYQEFKDIFARSKSAFDLSGEPRP